MKWLADENFRSAILRGLLRKDPTFDIVRAQDVREISGQDDQVLREPFLMGSDLRATCGRMISSVSCIRPGEKHP
ncbi:MAG: hypothetical protein C5B51_12640 [Terriglobia bacterium]|nr:MAG: hypothetical protein C5B51_12640 [Terriglobia bacterium]